MPSILLELNTAQDVIREYVDYRRSGLGREEAIQKILDSYAAELDDVDDGPQVWIGLAKATGKKHELTEDLLEKASGAFDICAVQNPEFARQFKEAKKRACNADLLGGEAKYPKKRKTRWKASWKVGELYSYQMQGEYPAKYGLDNWYALLYKTAELIDTDGKLYHVFCYAVSESIPSTSEELSSLEWLYYPNGSARQYSVRLYAPSAKTEKAYNLSLVGAFENVVLPNEEAYNPELYIYLLFAGNVRSAAGSTIPDIEVHFCHSYKKTQERKEKGWRPSLLDLLF
ncbi:MAG: hypothetical protein IKG01_15100 [Lachnospiraceae bacterium]|nr:hypothetical protein [Lachnospiraceae bacterium]